MGVAEYKITDDLLVSISYRDKSGDKLYPDPFFIGRREALRCPIQIIKGIRLRIIRLVDMELIPRRRREKKIVEVLSVKEPVIEEKVQKELFAY